METRQAVSLELDYADGGKHNEIRPFLVLKIDNKFINTLNISSITPDKVWKLAMNSNREIKKYKPPFNRPSFVKLDALYKLENNKILDNYIICNGQKLDGNEFLDIRKEYDFYSKKHKVLKKENSIKDILAINDIRGVSQAACTNDKGK